MVETVPGAFDLAEQGAITTDTATIADIKGCWTCGIVEEYKNSTTEYIDRLSDLLAAPMLAIFASVLVLWLVIKGIQLALGILKPEAVFKEFIFICIGGILLKSQDGGLISEVYGTCLKVMSGAAEVAFLAEPKHVPNSSYDGLTKLVHAAEDSVEKVFLSAASIAGSGNPISVVGKVILAILLIVPFFILLVLFFAQVVISIFRLLIVAAFSPFLMLAFAFGWGRGMAFAAVKTILSTAMVLFASTAALGMILNAVSGLEIDETREISFDNVQYLTAIMLGWMGTAFMAEARGIANSIAGTALSNEGAAIITAGAVGTAAAIKGAGLFGTAKLLSGGESYLQARNHFKNKAAANVAGYSQLLKKDVPAVARAAGSAAQFLGNSLWHGPAGVQPRSQATTPKGVPDA